MRISRAIGANVNWCARYFIEQLRPSIDQSDDVAEVAAPNKIALAPATERLKLHGKHVDGRRCSNASSGWKLTPDSVRQRSRLPLIVEAKDVRAGRHRVENQPTRSVTPPTDDSALLVFAKAGMAELRLEAIEVASRDDLNNDIYVICRT